MAESELANVLIYTLGYGLFMRDPLVPPEYDPDSEDYWEDDWLDGVLLPDTPGDEPDEGIAAVVESTLLAGHGAEGSHSGRVRPPAKQ